VYRLTSTGCQACDLEPFPPLRFKIVITLLDPHHVSSRSTIGPTFPALSAFEFYRIDEFSRGGEFLGIVFLQLFLIRDPFLLFATSLIFTLSWAVCVSAVRSERACFGNRIPPVVVAHAVTQFAVSPLAFPASALVCVNSFLPAWDRPCAVLFGKTGANFHISIFRLTLSIP